MERWNSEGIRRDELDWALRDGRLLLKFRKINSCMLCRRRGNVNEASLCDVCWVHLTEDELRLAQPWLNGVRP